MLKQKISSPPFAGLVTFAKFPIITADTFSKGENGFGIIGIPYDMGVTNIPGARFGPREIRAASTQYAHTSSEDFLGQSDSRRGFFDINQDKWILKNIPCFDMGDIEVVVGDPKSTFELITSSVKKILDFKITPVILGGDHAITYPIIQAFNNLKDITILHFDAHMDYWDPSKNSIYDHSCAMWNISHLPNIKHIYQLGIRGLNHYPALIEDAKKHNITSYTSQDIRINLKNILEKFELSGNLYISFDIDFFDPSVAPGTGNREQAGFNYLEASELIHTILKSRKINLIGLDLVEINPLIDVSNVTSSLGARLILDILGMFN